MGKAKHSHEEIAAAVIAYSEKFWSNGLDVVYEPFSGYKADEESGLFGEYGIFGPAQYEWQEDPPTTIRQGILRAREYAKVHWNDSFPVGPVGDYGGYDTWVKKEEKFVSIKDSEEFARIETAKAHDRAKIAALTSKTCDDCDEQVDELLPIEDPWGGVHGHICESCNEARQEGAAS